jgi:CRP-like cAMP-binding protein
VGGLSVITREIALAGGSFLRVIGREAAAELLRTADHRTYQAGQLMLGELEPGDELLVILSGKAMVSVGRGGPTGEERLGEVCAGEEVGEVALLTGSLRSASVTALEPMEVLALRRDRVTALMVRHPAVARHFVDILSARLKATDIALARALDPARRANAPPLEGLPAPERRLAAHPRSLRRLLQSAFRELVVERRSELPFFALAGFLGAVVLARFGIWALHGVGLPLLPLLRLFYVGGVLLLVGTAGAAPFVFRRGVRRALCLGFGTGAGLLVNELSVLLAFDIFFRDIFERDPTLRFDPALLYHRSANLWAFALLLVAFAQATYFQEFYRRVYYLLRERLRARGRGVAP